MGIYIYTLSGKRDITGDEVYEAKFSSKLSSSELESQHRYCLKHANKFETAPLFVWEFKHLERVYRKADCDGFFFDCDDIGEHYGWLMKVGRAYQVITISQLDEHVRSMSSFNDFDHLIQATGSHYRPSIYKRDGYMNVVLADIFDEHWNQTGPWINLETQEISDGVESFRSNPKWKPETQAYRGT